MARVEGGWEVRLTDLPVDRLEYLLDVDGRPAPRPGQPARRHRDRSETTRGSRCPGYREPAWLGARAGAAGERTPLTLSRTAVGRIDTEIWSPADAAGRRAAAAADQPRRPGDGRLRRAHGVRRSAGRRGSPAADAGRAGRRGRAQQEVRRQPGVRPGALHRLVPALREAVPIERTAGADGPEPRRAGGAARGVDRARRRSPGCSCRAARYFTADLDPQESGFEFWPEVTGFVASVRAAEQAAPGCAGDHADLRHRRGEPRQQRRDARHAGAASASRPAGARSATATPGPAGATPSTLT